MRTPTAEPRSPGEIDKEIALLPIGQQRSLISRIRERIEDVDALRMYAQAFAAQADRLEQRNARLAANGSRGT